MLAMTAVMICPTHSGPDRNDAAPSWKIGRHPRTAVASTALLARSPTAIQAPEAPETTITDTDASIVTAPSTSARTTDPSRLSLSAAALRT